MVAFDNTILSLLIFSDAELRQGSDGQKVEHARERVLGLVQQIEETRDRVIVPTPALSELLVTEGADVQDILTTLRSSAYRSSRAGQRGNHPLFRRRRSG